MTSSQDSAQRLKKKSLLLYLAYLLFLAVSLVVGAEVVLRQRGIKPWQPDDSVVQVDPGGSFSRPHPTLGYTHIPGRFAVTLPTGFSFTVTHLPNTLRITHPLDSYGEANQKPELWIFGCSFTHGWSLNDEETYPWLLQEGLPEYEVVNFGVRAYGTMHSLIQFREALKSRVPKVAVLAYAGFHDERNALSRMRRKRFVPSNTLSPLVQPCARLENGVLQYSMEKAEYQEFPLMRRLALAHYVEMTYNRLEYRRYQSRSVSQALIAEMASLAKRHEVKFIIAGIHGGQAMLDWAKSNGIPGVDISVDLNIRENTNLPHDGHASAIANKKYADTLEAFLRANVLQ